MPGTLSYKNEPKSAYLVNNPIVFELQSTVQQLIYYSITINSVVIFSGTSIPTGSAGEFEANIQISEIVKSYMQKSQILSMSVLVAEITNSHLPISVVFTQSGNTLNYSGKVYQGGIGKKMIRYLKSQNTDIFTYKLLNSDKQSFMTTRTSGRHIVIKENELFPIYFIASDKAYTVVTDYGNVFAFPELTPGNMYAFNVQVLRNASFTSYGKIPSYLGILLDGKFVFDIIIKKPAATPDKYIIRFANSFSAYEQIEVTGKAIAKPELTDNAFMIYDQLTDDYIEQNNRLKIREIIHADFGYKTLDEFLFIRDMLQSDKKYLIDQIGKEHEVRISADDFTHDIVPREPGSIKLIIKFVDTDINHSPDVDDSLPEFNFGEAIWETGTTNGYGFLFSDLTLKTS